ncbi:piRNA biogenesis protein EXD1-like [Sitophilus oryzae]|uniref:PiRNA biogenesis protein EXD1-like n=1 Tax=Sitophilus oryzae TaxID=7048 RepID=A0A6J2YPY8_SITOR|nr:piRNA biogenesis protein EXD1-like [Sitophilus oryzae]
MSDWKSNLLNKIVIIKDVDNCKKATESILCKVPSNIAEVDSWPYVEEKQAIGLDCEGVNLGERGDITLIQLITEEQIYIFDVQVCPAIIENGIKDILENNNIIKVMQACRNDVLNLFCQFQVQLNCVFDTQVAHGVITKQNGGSGDFTAGLNRIFEYYGVPPNPLKKTIKNIYRWNQKYWSKRPLTEEMILYAAADVEHLISDKMYCTMRYVIEDGEMEESFLFKQMCIERTVINQRNNSVSQKKNKRRLKNMKKRRTNRDPAFVLYKSLLTL